MALKDKLQEYALIAEIISAAAIMVSLIFVGMEIRASTGIARTTAYQNVMSELISNREILQTVPGMGEIVGNVSFSKAESWNEDERSKASGYFLNRMSIYELAYVSYQNEVFSEQEWSRWPIQICTLYLATNQPTQFTDGEIINYWDRWRTGLIPSFVSYIENTC